MRFILFIAGILCGFMVAFMVLPKERSVIEISRNVVNAINDAKNQIPREENSLVPVRAQVSKTLPLNKIKNLSIESEKNLKVKFVPTDGDFLLFSLIGESSDYLNQGQSFDDWFSFKVRGTRLDLRSHGDLSNMPKGSVKAWADLFKKDETDPLTLIVEYPSQQTFDNVEVKGINITIHANELKFKNFSMSSVFGDAVMENSQGETLSVEQVSGVSKFSVNGLKKASFETISSDTQLTSLSGVPEIEFESVSGDFELTLPKDSQVDVNFESLTGELVNDFGITSASSKKLKFSSLSGDAVIHKMK